MATRARDLTMEQIRSTGLNALLEALGVVGTVRFLQYAEKGQGDYTKDRHRWLANLDLDQVAREIEKIKKQNSN